MANLYDLDLGPGIPEVIRMIVEIPKNSANKYEYDGELGVFGGAQEQPALSGDRDGGSSVAAHAARDRAFLYDLLRNWKASRRASTDGGDPSMRAS
jgi:hypothetical protein